MVIWIIGKSGSGKTFFAKKIYSLLNKRNNCFLIDGDEVENILIMICHIHYKIEKLIQKK